MKLFWVKLLAQFILCAFEVCSKTHTTFMPVVWSCSSVVHLWFTLYFPSPQLALQILLAIMVGWLANYFVSDLSPEATRDAYLYAVGISAIFLVLGVNHAWAFLWAQEHGEILLFHAYLYIDCIYCHTYNTFDSI